MSVEFYCDTHESVKEALSYGFRPIILGELAKIPTERGWINKYTSISPDMLLAEAADRAASNVGIFAGTLSGIICIDVDIQHNGMEEWMSILSRHGITDIDSLQTPIVRTGSGGRHYYFKMEKVFEEASPSLSYEKTKIRGIDVKVSGGLVYPGSIYGGCSSSPHKCGMSDDDCLFRGNAYTWIRSPYSTHIESVPSWLRSYIKKRKTDKNLVVPTITKGENGKDKVENKVENKVEKSHEKNEEDTRIHEIISILKSRADSYSDWRDTIWCLRGLGYNLSIAHLFSKQSEKYNADSVETIWNYYDNRVSWNWGTIRNWLKEILNEDEYRVIVLKYFPDLSKEDMSLQGDWGLTKLFVDTVKHKFKVVDEKGNGYLFDGKTALWKKYPFAFLNNLVSDELKPLLEGFITNTKCSNDDETNKRKDLLRKPLKIVLSYTGSNMIAKKAVKELVSTGFTEKLNKIEHLFPIKNGKVIDLKTLEVRSRTMDDMFSIESPVEYTPKETYPVAEEFFKGICCGDKEYIDYLRRFCAYCMSGSIADRSFYIMTGSGLNGKSTLMTILNKILGGFYTPLSEDVMISFDRKGAATPEILPLLYSRLGVLPESKDDVTLNCERVKRLTGSDVLTCRPLYQEEISFETQSKIVLMTNNLPKFNAFDKAMTDRVKILPFNAEFTNNPVYVDKLKENIDEIFTYILQDSLDLWKNRNLGTIPRIMREATAGYFKDNDTVAMFIEDRCEIGQEYKVGAKDIYDEYSNWCEVSKQKRMSRQSFSKVLEAKFEKKRVTNGNVYLGIKLLL